MKTRNRFSLVVLPVAALLWMASAQTTAPVSAQGGMWEESALPDGYILRGIKFFDGDHGSAWGVNYDQGQGLPFLFETADGGATWTEETNILRKLKSWSKIYSINISGRNLYSEYHYSRAEDFFVLSAELIYAGVIVRTKTRIEGGAYTEGEAYRVFRTTDGGQSWSPAVLTDESDDGRLAGVIPVPQGGVWILLHDNIATAYQLMYSPDGIKFNPRFISDLPNNTVKGLTFPRSDFGYVEVYFVSMEDKRYAHELRFTSDGGGTWMALPPLPDLQFEHLSDFFFLDEKTGWAAGYASGEQGPQAAFLRTTDGGSIWEETLIMPSGEERFELSMQSMKFQNPQVGFVIGGQTMAESRQAILYMTADGGTVWEEVLQDTYIGCLETTDTQVFVCASGGILRMELPAPRPTPTPSSTPTLTPVPPTKTPIPTATSTPVPNSGWDWIPCASAPVVLFLGLFWLTGEKDDRYY